MDTHPAALPDIDAVEIVDLRSGPSPFRPPTDPPRQIRIERVTGETAQEIARLWQLLPPGEVMRCHAPPYGFHFYDQGHLLFEADVCWRCNSIHMRQDGQSVGGYTFDGEADVSLELLALAKRIMGHDRNLPTVEDWIGRLLSQSIDELNAAFTWKADAKTEKKLEARLEEPKKNLARAGSADAEVVEALHRKIRGQKCESKVWAALIFYIGEFPAAVAHDLIDRDKMVNTLGHTRQSDEVQWRLAGQVPEALVTFVWDMFTQSRYSADELEKLLGQAKYPHDLIGRWEHGVLYSPENRERDKEIIFHRWAWEHRELALERKSPLTIPTPEQFLELMEEKERKAAAAQLQIKQEKEAERLRIEAEQRTRDLELERFGTTLLADEEIERILAAKEPDALLALAGNRVIEKRWVEKLANCYGVKGARAIREAVAKNLEERG